MMQSHGHIGTSRTEFLVMARPRLDIHTHMTKLWISNRIKRSLLTLLQKNKKTYQREKISLFNKFNNQYFFLVKSTWKDTHKDPLLNVVDHGLHGENPTRQQEGTWKGTKRWLCTKYIQIWSFKGTNYGTNYYMEFTLSLSLAFSRSSTELHKDNISNMELSCLIYHSYPCDETWPP